MQRTFVPKTAKKRKRKHGFRARKQAGGAVLKSRRQKGRVRLAA